MQPRPGTTPLHRHRYASRASLLEHPAVLQAIAQHLVHVAQVPSRRPLAGCAQDASGERTALEDGVDRRLPPRADEARVARGGIEQRAPDITGAAAVRANAERTQIAC